MQKAAFIARCPFEIGDRVNFLTDFGVKTGTLTDIIAVHSLKDGTVTFVYEIDNAAKVNAVSMAFN